MQAPDHSDWTEYLDPAAGQIQRLNKKLRRWLNAGHALPEDLNDSLVALEAIRRIYARHEIPAFDRDSRSEKARTKLEKSMLFEVNFEANGHSGQNLIAADNEDEAIAKFVAAWEQNGDKWNGSCWVSARWKQQG